MDAARRWRVDDETPAERTDPLLPVITAESVAPAPPALDDRRLAGLLAELDAEDPLLADEPVAERVERVTARRVEGPVDVLPAPRPAEPAPRRPPPLVIDQVCGDAVPAHAVSSGSVSSGSVSNGSVSSGSVSSGSVSSGSVSTDLVPVRDPAPRYVRRDQPPAEPPPDAVGLSGLNRVGSSRVGTMLFTAFFLGIFVLILVEVVVSLLRVSS